MSGDELVVRAEGSLSTPHDAATVVDMTKRVREILDAVMKNGIHYGTIPGTSKPTLFQPGAEKLCLTFGLSPSYSVEDLCDAETAVFRVTCALRSRQTGEVVAEGLGQASSAEEKYRWRAPTCQEEFDETPESRRREKWRSGKNGSYKTKQIRTEAADISNTVLQMARKRALVAATRTAVAASDVFDQDVDDLVAIGIELERVLEHPEVKTPQPTPPPAPPKAAPAPAAPPPAAPQGGPPAAAPPAMSMPDQEDTDEMPPSPIPQKEWDAARAQIHNKAKATEKMIARLMAKARENGWTPEDVQGELERQLGVHLSALPGFQFYDAVVSIFERNRKP